MAGQRPRPSHRRVKSRIFCPKKQKMIFVDTNYFLRFLLADNKEQFHEVKPLFGQAAEGRVKLFTSIVVYFEIYWVLSSFYKQDKSETAKTLQQLLEMDFISLEEHEIL